MMDAKKAARSVGLKYVNDKEPGIHRVRRGKGFAYVDDKKKPVKAKHQLERIKALVIPPAWEDVWICTREDGHLQVTGLDARGRKQYRYHPDWSAHRNETKFDKLADLCGKVAVLRKQVEADLKLPGLPQDKVLAAIVKLIMVTQTRVGNAEYAETNESYGLTTIRNKHATVRGPRVQLSFKGKSGVEHEIDVNDATVAKIVRKCQDLPGQELFGYLADDGHVVDVTSSHVNEYLKRITGEDFTAKDLRTLGGTCKALATIADMGEVDYLSEKKWNQRHREVIKQTAEFLRNTVAVCKKYYIHPSVFAADQKGKLLKLWKSANRASKYSTKEELVLQKLLKAA